MLRHAALLLVLTPGAAWNDCAFPDVGYFAVDEGIGLSFAYGASAMNGISPATPTGHRAHPFTWGSGPSPTLKPPASYPKAIQSPLHPACRKPVHWRVLQRPLRLGRCH